MLIRYVSSWSHRGQGPRETELANSTSQASACTVKVASTLGEAKLEFADWVLLARDVPLQLANTTARHCTFVSPTVHEAHQEFLRSIVMPNATRNHLRNARGHVREGARGLRNGMRKATRQGEALGESLSAAAASMAGAAVDFANQSAEHLRERATAALAEGQARARQVGESIGSRIQERPVRSVFIAAVVGFVLGLFFLRRRS